MVADEPVAPDLLAQLLELPTAVVERAVRRAAGGYDEAGHGFAAGPGGRRLPLPDPPRPGALRRAVRARRPAARLSAAALETLAIVAYKQPISRAQVAAIRGVDPDGVLRTLQAARLHRRGRPRPRARPGGPVRHHAAVPRAARPRLARRPAAARRLRPGRRRRRGARARPARRPCPRPMPPSLSRRSGSSWPSERRGAAAGRAAAEGAGARAAGAAAGCART